MEKRVVVLFLFFLLILTIISFLFREKVFFAPPVPTNCTDIEIKKAWDSIFKETSSGTTIITNTTRQDLCENFLAYKLVSDNVYLMTGFYRINNTINQSQVYTLKGNLTAQLINEIRNITAENVNGQHMFLPIFIINSANVGAYPRNISSVQEAFLEFNSTFKVGNTSTFVYDDVSKVYYFATDNSVNGNTAITSGGVHSLNFTVFYSDTLFYINNVICTPNWTAINTSCRFDDTIVTYYNDTNHCNNSIGIPANQTRDCDYNNYGIIGTISDLTKENINVTVLINGSIINLTRQYTATQNIKIREDNITRVSSDYNFSKEPLNFRNLNIKKQSSSANRGLLVFNGLDLAKTFNIDKLNSSSLEVCVKDTNSNSVSNQCSGLGESLFSCPSSTGNFSCQISGNLFVVSGLRHSAVQEYYVFNPASCTSSWNCTAWTTCSTLGSQIRTCTDRNNCGTFVGKPQETQPCTSPPQCNPDWNCTSWNPAECNQNQTQIRTCMDRSNCNTDTGKPQEQRSCVYQSKQRSVVLIVSIVGAIFALLTIILIVLLVILNKKNKKEGSPPQINYSPSPVQNQPINFGYS